MIKVILLDDEKPALDELRYLLEKKNKIEIIGSYTDPIEALGAVRKNKPDIVFLDIEMPEINGLQMAREIIRLGRDVAIIFVTAYDRYAVKAFEVNALDYVMKPIAEDRLNQCIKKVLSLKGYDGLRGNKVDGIDRTEKEVSLPPSKIVVWQEDEIILLKPSQICYLIAEQGNTYIVTADSKYKLKESLEAWERKLKMLHFFRCHRAFIVNLDKIQKISTWFGSTYTISLEGTDDTVPLSKRNAKHMKEMIMRLDAMPGKQ